MRPNMNTGRISNSPYPWRSLMICSLSRFSALILQPDTPSSLLRQGIVSSLARFSWFSSFAAFTPSEQTKVSEKSFKTHQNFIVCLTLVSLVFNRKRYPESIRNALRANARRDFSYSLSPFRRGSPEPQERGRGQASTLAGFRQAAGQGCRPSIRRVPGSPERK